MQINEERLKRIRWQPQQALTQSQFGGGSGGGSGGGGGNHPLTHEDTNSRHLASLSSFIRHAARDASFQFLFQSFPRLLWYSAFKFQIVFVPCNPE
jgi:hypothetical protein